MTQEVPTAAVKPDGRANQLRALLTLFKENKVRRFEENPFWRFDLSSITIKTLDGTGDSKTLCLLGDGLMENVREWLQHMSLKCGEIRYGWNDSVKVDTPRRIEVYLSREGEESLAEGSQPVDSQIISEMLDDILQGNEADPIRHFAELKVGSRHTIGALHNLVRHPSNG